MATIRVVVVCSSLEDSDVPNMSSIEKRMAVGSWDDSIVVFRMPWPNSYNSLVSKFLFDTISGWDIDFLVFDESQTISSVDSLIDNIPEFDGILLGTGGERHEGFLKSFDGTDQCLNFLKNIANKMTRVPKYWDVYAIKEEFRHA